MTDTRTRARIILEDGTEFEGTAFGHERSAAGEIVFYVGNADMPRLLTDPALQDAIVVLAQPAAGIPGIPEDAVDGLGLETEFESPGACIAGLVCETVADEPSGMDGAKPLGKWLKKQQVTGIAGIDTRALIARLRTRGTMRAKILVGDSNEISFGSAGGRELPATSSTKRSVNYGTGATRIIAVDCGIRYSTIRTLARDGITVTRVPYSFDYSKEEFDAVFVGGGPGDPTSCVKTVSVLRAALKQKKPVFATGQGAVILALAGGASAFRMPNGHRSASVPVIDLSTGRCLMTAQNHGYGIREGSLPDGWDETFLNNVDRSIEGFSAEKGLITGTLFQCEGFPGPHDADFLIDDFLARAEATR